MQKKQAQKARGKMQASGKGQETRGKELEIKGKKARCKSYRYKF